MGEWGVWGWLKPDSSFSKKGIKIRLNKKNSRIFVPV
jgi:hypothetical protein